MKTIEKLIGTFRSGVLKEGHETFGPNYAQALEAALKFSHLFKDEIDLEFAEVDARAARGEWKENTEAWVAYEKRWRELKHLDDYAARYAVFLSEEFGLQAGARPLQLSYIYHSTEVEPNYSHIRFYIGHPINGDGMSWLSGSHWLGDDIMLKSGHPPLKRFHPKKKLRKQTYSWKDYEEVKLTFEAVDRDTGKEAKLSAKRRNPYGLFVYDQRFFSAFQEPDFFKNPEKVLKRLFPDQVKK